MTTVALAALAMLGAAAALVLVRIARGPSNLDRIVATDILLVVVIAAVALESVRQRTATYLPLLVVLGLVAFVGGVAVTRFLSRDGDDTPGADADTPGADADAPAPVPNPEEAP